MARETPSATSPSAGLGDRATALRSSEIGIFRKEGEFWTVGYGDKAFRPPRASLSDRLDFYNRGRTQPGQKETRTDSGSIEKLSSRL
jgi:hypothetical protein